MSWLSNLVYGKDDPATRTEGMMGQAIAGEGASSSAATSRYLTDSAAFDPGQAYKSWATGAFGDFQTGLTKNLRDLGGKAVGAGRFDSGFFDEDQGQLVRDMSSDFSNKLVQGSLTASGQRLSQLGQEGQFAEQQSQDYNELLAGELDRETAKSNAKKQQRSDFWGGLLKGGATIAAAALL